MTKKFSSLLIFIITLSSCAQNKTEEITTDNNGNIIVRKEITNEKELVKTSEEILEEFYKNQNDIESLDKLISFRSYQKTPYVKFKETMETKNKVCGKLIEKKIVEKEFSEDKKAIRYKILVNYEKKKTIEQIVMIKETENSNFLIFDYNIKTN